MADTTTRAGASTSNWLMLAAWFLYLASLALPTAKLNAETLFGVHLLVYGFLLLNLPSVADLWYLVLVLSWLTNFVFWTSWLIFRRARRRHSNAVAYIVPFCLVINVTLGLGAALGFVFRGAGLLENPGYYAWLGSFAASCAAIYCAARNGTAAI